MLLFYRSGPLVCVTISQVERAVPLVIYVTHDQMVELLIWMVDVRRLSSELVQDAVAVAGQPFLPLTTIVVGAQELTVNSGKVSVVLGVPLSVTVIRR